MKKILVSMLAVAALVACSKDDVIVADKGDAIGFDTFVENATRVANSADSSLTVDAMKTGNGFGVYGFVTNGGVTAPLFTNAQVKWTDGAWKYADTQYWIAGATYDFAAIAPYGAYEVTSATRNGVTLSFTNDGETDLLYDQNNGIPGDDHTLVAFAFRHLLSKVKFTFTNGYNATNTLIAVKNIVINDTYAKGVANLGFDAANVKVTADWNVNSVDANLDLAFGDAVTGGYIQQGASEQSAKSLLLIPAQKRYNVTFVVELYYKDGDGYTLIDTYNHNVVLDADFEFGKSYNVVTTITYQNIDPEVETQYPIEFFVREIKNWANGGTTTLN